MARSRYEIAIDTQYQGRGAKEADKDMKALDKTTTSTSEKFKGFAVQGAAAGAVLTGIGIAAKEAYEFIGEGAALTAAAGKFDNLAASINTTGDALLGKMKEATKGLISDAELIAAGTDIMNLGLAKTEGGVVRMATAVGALNLDMGVLALTLANDSTARLDSLSLSLEDVTQKKKDLIASGFIGDAFDEAVLIALEEKMVLMGDASETTAGKMQIAEAAAANISDTLKILAADVAAVPMAELATQAQGLAKDINTLKDAFDKASEEEQKQSTAMDKVNQAAKNYLTVLNPLNAVMLINKKIWGEIVGAANAYTRTGVGVEKATKGIVTAQREGNGVTDEFNDKLRQSVNLLDDEYLAYRRGLDVKIRTSDAAEDLADKTRQMSNRLTDEEIAYKNNIDAQMEFGAQMRENIEVTRVYSETIAGIAADSLEPMEGATIDYKNALLDEASALGITQQQMVLLATATGDYTEEQIEAALESAIMAEAVKEMAQAVSDGDITVSEALSGLEDLQEELDGGSESSIALGQNVDSVTESINNLPKDVEIVFTSDLSAFQVPGGFTAQQAAAGQGAGVPQFANGGDFTVPPGFPNDSFPMRVQSGEHVTVTPAGQQRQSGSPTYIFNNQTEAAQALALATVAQQKRANHSAFMGG